MGICGLKVFDIDVVDKNKTKKKTKRGRNRKQQFKKDKLVVKNVGYVQIPNDIHKQNLDYEQQKDFDPSGLVGLQNIGNTCFINSALQCLLNVQPLVNYFLSELHVVETNSSNPLGSKGKITQVFAELVNQVWCGNSDYIVPERFLNVVRDFSSIFGDNTQQDSQEFLIFLLDFLHEDLNRVKVKPYVIDKDYESNNVNDFESYAVESWRNYLLRNKSIVVDLFQGQLKSTLRCLTCQALSHKFETFMYLSVPIPEKSNNLVTLEDCIEEFTREENLDQSEWWFCTRCKKHSPSTKKIDLWKAPNILIVHLKRFQYTRNNRGKINKFVDFKLQNLDLTSIVAGKEKKSPIYDLFAVCDHSGSLGRGHYTAYAKNNDTQDWFLFDDSTVTQVKDTFKQILSPKAYVLFYSKTSVDKFQRQTISRPECWPHIINSAAGNGNLVPENPEQKKRAISTLVIQKTPQAMPKLQIGKSIVSREPTSEDFSMNFSSNFSKDNLDYQSIYPSILKVKMPEDVQQNSGMIIPKIFSAKKEGGKGFFQNYNSGNKVRVDSLQSASIKLQKIQQSDQHNIGDQPLEELKEGERIQAKTREDYQWNEQLDNLDDQSELSYKQLSGLNDSQRIFRIKQMKVGTNGMSPEKNDNNAQELTPFKYRGIKSNIQSMSPSPIHGEMLTRQLFLNTHLSQLQSEQSNEKKAKQMPKSVNQSVIKPERQKGTDFQLPQLHLKGMIASNKYVNTENNYDAFSKRNIQDNQMNLQFIHSDHSDSSIPTYKNGTEENRASILARHKEASLQNSTQNTFAPLNQDVASNFLQKKTLFITPVKVRSTSFQEDDPLNDTHSQKRLVNKELNKYYQGQPYDKNKNIIQHQHGDSYHNQTHQYNTSFQNIQSTSISTNATIDSIPQRHKRNLTTNPTATKFITVNNPSVFSKYPI